MFYFFFFLPLLASVIVNETEIFKLKTIRALTKPYDYVRA